MYEQKGKDVHIKAQVELEIGPLADICIVAFQKWVFADPGIDLRMNAEASMVDFSDEYEKKSGYDNIPCVSLHVQGPLLTVYAATGEESILKLLIGESDLEYHFIDKDSNRVPYNEIFHVERDLNGRISMIQLKDEQTHEDVCTHIELKEPKEDITDKIGDEIDQKAEDIKGDIGQSFEKLLEQLLEESCAGCF